MRTLLCLAVSVAWLAIPDRPLTGAQPMNVLLICADDLRPELGCYGKDYIHSPNIDALAARGKLFARHYVQAPTCGASRYTLLTGQYGPSGNEALFARAKRLVGKSNQASVTGIDPTMPEWFRQQGYTTVSVGKVSHHPGGRGGADWDDDATEEIPGAWTRHRMPSGPWKHPRGAMHGLAHGEIRGDAKSMDLFQSTPGDDTIYPDGWIVNDSIEQLDQLATGESPAPFFLAVGLIRPHLPFGAPAAYMQHYADATLPPTPHPDKPQGKTTWHSSGEFMKYNRWGRDPNRDAEFATLVRKHYAACVSYTDAGVGRLLEKLDALGLRENTIVVLWGDHGWHLGEHAIWGKHALFEESLHSPLVISDPRMTGPGTVSTQIVETLDLYPTLCDLAGVPVPSFVHGESLRGAIESKEDTTSDQGSHVAVSYAAAKTIRNDRFRMIEHRDGFIELYDHESPETETKNVASEYPEVVRELKQQLAERLGRKS